MNNKFYISLMVLLFTVPTGLLAQTPPVAANDYVVLYTNETTEVPILANDTYDSTHTITIIPLGVSSFQGTAAPMSNGSLSIRLPLTASGSDTLFYQLRDMTLTLFDTGMIVMNITPARNAAFLDINGVNALVNANGNLFWDQSALPFFEVPVGSGNNTLFTTSLMFGGKDDQDCMRLMMDQYNQVMAVYAGPLDVTDGQNDSLTLFQHNRVWKLTAAEIMDFRNHYWESGYAIPDAIQNWPAHGDVSKGQPQYLAPFADINQDGNYVPQDGDYPLIKGDQAILFICNNPVSGTEADYLTTGMQAIGMVYAYECNADTLFNSAVFIDYTVINSNVFAFSDAYLGMFADFDIGFAYDDYMGTFVDVQTLYGYNGDTLDQNSTTLTGYGNYPPAQGITLLTGPLADPGDGIDNDFDNTTDEAGETCGLYSTVVLNNAGAVPGVLQDDKDYFYTLHGYYNDTIPVKWGQPYASDTSSATPCRYMFPGTSDPTWLGTNGVAQTPALWSEYLQTSTPFDRRGIMSFGPLTFGKNERKSFTVALVYAQKDGLPYYQVPDLLHARIETLLDYYATDSIPCGGSFSGIAQTTPEIDFNIYPNPSSNVVTMEFNQQTIDGKNAVIKIFNLNGQCVMTLPCTGQQTSFSVSGLREGVYIVQFSDTKINTSKRLMIVR